jgi:hypothetical protein
MNLNLQNISSVDDRSCTAPAGEREEYRHSGFYSNTQLSLPTL